LVAFFEERNLRAAALTVAQVAVTASWYLQTSHSKLLDVNIGKPMMPVLHTAIEQMPGSRETDTDNHIDEQASAHDRICDISSGGPSLARTHNTYTYVDIYIIICLITLRL
jgi:hypothetical protein